MGPLEQNLGELARKHGWRLRWKSEPLATAPRMVMTELDVFRGKILLTRYGPYWVVTGRTGTPRETIAGMVSGYP